MEIFWRTFLHTLWALDTSRVTSVTPVTLNHFVVVLQLWESKKGCIRIMTRSWLTLYWNNQDVFVLLTNTGKRISNKITSVKNIKGRFVYLLSWQIRIICVLTFLFCTYRLNPWPLLLKCFKCMKPSIFHRNQTSQKTSELHTRHLKENRATREIIAAFWSRTRM